MSGFDNGTLFGGIQAQVKQIGTILRGFGPPVPQSGVLGDCYIDVLTWQFFNKRSSDPTGDIDPWGHYLFVVPDPYRTGLKYFSSSFPTVDIGVTGDYCLLWGGNSNYGMRAAVYGPKQDAGWPENGIGPDTVVSGATVGQIGLLDEGAAVPESNSTQLIATGLLNEVIYPLAVTTAPGDAVGQIGLQSGPVPILPTINPLYSAEDVHEV